MTICGKLAATPTTPYISDFERCTKQTMEQWPRVVHCDDIGTKNMGA